MNSPSLDVSKETLVEESTEDFSGLSYPDCTILRPSRRGEMEGPGRRLVRPPGTLAGGRRISYLGSLVSPLV